MTICLQPLLVKYLYNKGGEGGGGAIKEGAQQGVLTHNLRSTQDIPKEGPLLG